MNERFLIQISELLGIVPREEDVVQVLPKLSESLSLDQLSLLLTSRPHHPLWSELVRELTIPETYFYRIAEHWALFQILLNKAVSEGRSLKVWCAAASTGEEPYTVAIEAARAKGVVDIVATDLVAERLEFAREALFTENSFRGVPSEIKATFFRQEGRSYRLIPSIREVVRFKPLNLAEREAMESFCLREGPFDIIFCRNVLIYFCEDVCRAVTEIIASALKPQGLLFAGGADFPSRWNDSLESVQLQGALVWRNKTCSPTKSPPRKASISIARETQRSRLVPSAREIISKEISLISVDVPKEIGTKKERVDELFRGGDLNLKLQAARGYVDRHLLHPVGHLALGNVLELLEQHDAALDAYKKVVFLEPTCAYAHLRLAHLHLTAKRGKAAGHHLAVAKRYGEGCDTTRYVLGLLELRFEDLLQSIHEMGDWSSGPQ